MAGVSDCFAIGSTVACRTCYNVLIEGEVQAFDAQTKMLVLRCPASNNRPSYCNVYIVNLSLVSDVQVKKEITTPQEPPKALNLNRISARVKSNIEHKRCLIEALKAGVTQDGMSLYNTITKTINEVTWQGANIVVMNQVTIVPPYKTENIQGDPHSKAFTHIRKVVEKHLRDSQTRSGMSGRREEELTGGGTKLAAVSGGTPVVAQSQ